MSPQNRNRTYRPKRNRRKRNWFRFILHCLVLALVLEVVALCLTSPRFRISRIDIRGAKTTPVAELRDRASSAMGKNIFLADTKRVRREVLKDPAIRSARIWRWPMNRLIVRVDEREPYAAVRSCGRWHLIDSGAFVFKEIKSPPKGLLVVELLGCGPLRLGSRAYPRLTLPALDCLRMARENSLAVSKISVDRASDICLNIESGLYVKIGQPREIREKLSILKDVLAAKPEMAREALYLELGCTGAPSWKPRQGSP